MGDTQWTIATDPANANPHTVPVSIINQVNRQFIDAGVKFVIEVGDLTEDGSDVSEITRAAAAQALIDAGIGFFPMRGNHETLGKGNSYSIPILQKIYPQTQTGKFTRTDTQSYKLGSNFSSPTSVSTDLAGISYSFDYGDAGDSVRFVILDTWATPGKVDNNSNKYAYGYTVHDQQHWINSRLDKNTRGTTHAFVLAHQPLLAENHQDTMFSGYVNANPDWQNAFFASLQDNGVKYFMSGHDHIHQRSIIASPDNKSKVQEIIAAPNSTKFYTPKLLTDALWFGQKGRETSISQEMNTVGYYIYTVDGPCVTVDFHSDDHGKWQSDDKYPNGAGKKDTGITPIFNFVKKESWGYCQNGKEFLIPQGATSYTTVEDSSGRQPPGFSAGRQQQQSERLHTAPLTKTVDTGWVDVDGWLEKYPAQKRNPDFDLVSNILTLRGMADLGITKTDTYAIQ